MSASDRFGSNGSLLGAEHRSFDPITNHADSDLPLLTIGHPHLFRTGCRVLDVVGDEIVCDRSYGYYDVVIKANTNDGFRQRYAGRIS